MQLKHIFFFLLLVTVLAACKKDKDTPEADVFYAVSIEGYDVTFNNTTTGAVSYRWDFGDSTSSTDASPVHTYPGKGKYVPTLYATTKDGRVTEASTVVYISKTSPVKLDDNTLADWEEVTTYEVTSGPGETYYKRAKFDYDANYIYIYLELNSTKANNDIYDFYMDTDNSATTGLLLPSLFPDGGYDVLLEGQLFSGGEWALGVLNHKDNQDDFHFDATGASEFYTVGTVVQDGPVMKLEMRLVRSKIKNMAATTAFRIGIQNSKNDWSATLGNMPTEKQPSVLINLE
jgi:hypothetical protein